jgi:hypothetical protein
MSTLAVDHRAVNFLSNDHAFLSGASGSPGNDSELLLQYLSKNYTKPYLNPPE